MIYTLTLNPSLDYILELDQIKLGELNRSIHERKYPGGKGINVSQVLNTLNVDSIALGYLGGFTGKQIIKLLQSQGIQTDFIPISEDTRINVKLQAVQETEINASGPAITDDNFQALLEKIKLLTSNDVLVLAGSVPATMPVTTYETLVSLCQKNGTTFVADMTGDQLKKVIPYKPLLIKPNHHELGEFFNTTITTCGEAIPYAQRLVDRGAQHVIVSLADQGAILATKEAAWIATVPQGELNGSVGAGDSMVAGFLAAIQTGKKLADAFRQSVAAGSATAFSKGLCTKETIMALLPHIDITKIV